MQVIAFGAVDLDPASCVLLALDRQNLLIESAEELQFLALSIKQDSQQSFVLQLRMALIVAIDLAENRFS